MTIYFTSDLHFGHNIDFIYKERGFASIEEHDAALIQNINNVVSQNDELYILGDIMLNDNEHGIECLKQLNGNIHIIFGNHDTPKRIEHYNALDNVECIGYAAMIKYRKWNFYISHYPTMTANFDDDKKPWQAVVNLYGHTHQKDNFYNDNLLMVHVGVDSRNCYPVSIDDVIAEIKGKRRVK